MIHTRKLILTQPYACLMMSFDGNSPETSNLCLCIKLKTQPPSRRVSNVRLCFDSARLWILLLAWLFRTSGSTLHLIILPILPLLSIYVLVVHCSKRLNQNCKSNICWAISLSHASKRLKVVLRSQSEFYSMTICYSSRSGFVQSIF